MTPNVHKLFLLLLLSVLFWGCNEEDSPGPVSSNKLEANAGEDREVQINSVVPLNGSASKDGNNKPFSYAWSFKSKPFNSTCTLSGSDTATPAFTPDVPGTYVIQLKLVQNNFFKTDEVIITAITSAPNTPTAITLNQNISSDLVLEDIFEDPAKPDYVATTDIIVSARLTIKPGVVIAFENDKSLQIYPQGILIAKGINTDRIIFTGKEPIKGYWKGIIFYSNNAENEMDNTMVAFGGSNSMPDVGLVRANVVLSGSSYSGAALKVSNSTFAESGGYGMYVQGMSELNYFFGNYFNNNSSSAVYVPARQLHKLDFFSHYTGDNGFNGIETGGVVKENSEVAWGYFNDQSKYFVSSDISIESGVRVTTGANFEFAKGTALRVVNEGYLNATGTAYQPITFSARIKTPNNYWKGIFFGTSHESNQLHYCTISHAGFSDVQEINLKANVAVSSAGKVSVAHSNIEHGLGWGIAGNTGSQVNSDIYNTNFFNNLVEGNLKLPFSQTITLAGEWVDEWSFNNGHYFINENFYHKNSNTWFNGAADPWSMNPNTGFGLKINEDGSYIWTIAEHSPWTGQCVSYSAEYITGNVEANGNNITFQQDYWRSKFYSSCNEDGNVDMDITPDNVVLRYEINRHYNMFTGAQYWELKLINPNDSFFTYYKF